MVKKIMAKGSNYCERKNNINLLTFVNRTLSFEWSLYSTKITIVIKKVYRLIPFVFPLKKEKD